MSLFSFFSTNKANAKLMRSLTQLSELSGSGNWRHGGEQIRLAEEGAVSALEDGANPNIMIKSKTDHQRPALWVAMHCFSTVVCHALIDRGADVWESGAVTLWARGLDDMLKTFGDVDRWPKKKETIADFLRLGEKIVNAPGAQRHRGHKSDQTQDDDYQEWAWDTTACVALGQVNLRDPALSRAALGILIDATPVACLERYTTGLLYGWGQDWEELVAGCLADKKIKEDKLALKLALGDNFGLAGTSKKRM